MPTPPIRPAALTHQVFRGTDAIGRELLTIDTLRSEAWIRVRHDVYADARLDRDHELACRAALARLPMSTVVAGPSAAFLHGIEHAAAYRDDVHVITPKSVRIGAQLRLRVHHLDLRPDEVDAGLIRRTSADRTAWDVARWLQPIDAVPIIDEMLRRDLTSLAMLSDLSDRYRGRRGWRRAEQVFGLADRDAQSPAESRLRMRLMLAGLPRPVVQCPVQISPTQVLHPDLGWPEWRVAVEYDGHWHVDPDQLHRDRQRLNRLVGAGWLVLHVTSRRLHNDFPGVHREVTAALSSRGWQPPRRPISRN